MDLNIDRRRSNDETNCQIDLLTVEKNGRQITHKIDLN